MADILTQAPNPSEQVSLVDPQGEFAESKDDYFEFEASPPIGLKPESDEPAAAKLPPPDEPAEPVLPEPKPAPVLAPKHSPETVAFATQRFGISPAEAEEMTPAELGRTIAHMSRHGQHVWEVANKQPEAKASPAVAEVDVITELENDGIDPRLLGYLRKQEEANQQLRNELSSIKPELQQMKSAPVHQRIAGLVAEMSPESAKTYAIGTPAFTKLFSRMGSIQRESLDAGERLTEQEIFEQSARSLGLVKVDTKKAETEEALKTRAKEYDENALATPSSRHKDSDVHTRVREVLNKHKLPVADKNERQVEWQ